MVRRWSASPLDFVLEALFHITADQWSPWLPGTPRPVVLPIGPEHWQGEFLRDVGSARIEGRRRFSVRAGHGVGKTSVEAWLILWFVLFHRNLKCPVTANSQDQLRDVVWAEVARWHRELPEFLKAMIEVSAERVVVKADPDGSFAVARTARPERPEALQGFHAETLAFFIEEASGIEDVIFETAGGALSSDHSWVFMFANPTRLSGYFHRSHHQSRGEWRTYHVPCQASSRVSPHYAEQIAREYGETSNVYRVRVLGEFPLTEDNSVISLGAILSAVGREVAFIPRAVVWGLDVARFGDDATALAKRQGNRLLEPVREWRKLDMMQVAGLVAKEYRETPDKDKPASINVDVIGLGAGVVDRLHELGLPVHGVNVAEAPADDSGQYLRQRDELWFKGRDWFAGLDVVVPRDETLFEELVAPTYKVESSGKMKVESKDDLKKRGVKSPNKADAFLLTFAGGDMALGMRRQAVAIREYDPFALSQQEFESHLASVSRPHTSRPEEYTPF